MLWPKIPQFLILFLTTAASAVKAVQKYKIGNESSIIIEITFERLLITHYIVHNRMQYNANRYVYITHAIYKKKTQKFRVYDD